ncbi:MAG: hypothetical protein QM811_09440 [Pirellulales bacterium]
MRIFHGLLFALALVLVVGCGKPDDGSFEVRGRVLVNGKPVAVQGVEQGTGWVKLQLWQHGPDGKPGETPVEVAVRLDGGFVLSGVQGNGRKGLMPGKYSLSLEAEENGKRLYPELAKGKSKSVREFAPGSEEIEIALP